VISCGCGAFPIISNLFTPSPDLRGAGRFSLPWDAGGGFYEYADQALIQIQSSGAINGEIPGAPWGQAAMLTRVRNIEPYGTIDFPYRGPAGCAGVTIFFASIVQHVDHYYLHQGMTRTQQPQMQSLLVGRTLAHEIGHALGIWEHQSEDGPFSFNCVMTYPSWNQVDDSTEWQDIMSQGIGLGHGFTNVPNVFDGCQARRGFRPHGPTMP
jgi:hypothetical protein